MYTIGEFATFGRVSARMLRHYDAIGLLTPARVDVHSGYRHYSNEQLHQLLRIVELRQLGVGLDRIAAVIHADDEGTAFRVALEQRKHEIESVVASETAQIAYIERRLRLLEGTEAMSESVIYKPVDAVDVYAVTGVAPGMGPENVGPVVGPLIEQLDQALQNAGRAVIEPAIFWYEATEDGERLTVHVSYLAQEPPRAGDDYRVVSLPAISTAATLTHRGDMSGIGDSWASLVEQLIEDGYRMTGPTREVYHVANGHTPGPDWVTELQIPVERAD